MKILTLLGIMYFCNFCNFETPLLETHLDHHTFHRNVNRYYYCGYKRCKKFFNNLAYLNTHLHRVHGLNSKKQKKCFNRFPADNRGKFICKINTCRKEVDSFTLLLKHLKNHIKKKQHIICPYPTCSRSSFTGHLSKYHRKCQHILLNDIEPEENNIILANSESVQTVNNLSVESNVQESVEEFEFQNTQFDADTGSKLFIQNVAQFYLKLESELLIPASTVQYIVEETNTIHVQGQEVVKQNIRARLLTENIEQDRIDEIIKDTFSYSPWSTSHNILRTNYTRKKFYVKEFDYVKPTFVDLDKKKKTFFAYVPIMDTLTSIFKDKSIEKILNLTVPVANKDFLADFTDGEVFKNNTFFKNNTESLQIILYQDAFEIVNPIGPAKRKHKILAIYMNIGNLPDTFRSHVNTIKLVALVKEKDFDHNAVYGRVVDDLKILESEGIQVNGKFIKGSVVFIAGDNLGSHGLGGFLENFSKAKYFCRFCYINREEFHLNGGECKFYKNRTIASYKEDLEELKNKNESHGIKFDSVFNQLSNYHVCSPGLPPCLGHDLFEGIVAFDLILYIQYFVTNNWFTLDYLNKRIENFPYSLEDRKSKPCTISSTNTKVPGGACQIWNFLRLFPILISDKILEVDNDVWMCILLLNEIVEIVCAPVIHKSYLPYLQNIIFQYLSMRKQLFPDSNLRPKHHYLAHYCYLILLFGPLMKVWTLRYESKHRYFKRAVRYILNFINVLKSLSEKHELLQCLVRLGSDIRIETAVYDVQDFQLHLYNTEIQKCVQNSDLPRSIKQCNKVVMKGTTYKQGDVLALDQEGYHYQLIVGKICLFFCNEDCIFILCEVLKNEYIPYLNAYHIGETVMYTIKSLKKVLDYKPMHVYTINNMLYIKSSHAFVSRHI